MTPAETLRRAADVLDRLDGAATPMHRTAETVPAGTTAVVVEHMRLLDVDAALIFAARAAVPGLAAWLRSLSEGVRMGQDWTPEEDHALRVARDVLAAAGEGT